MADCTVRFYPQNITVKVPAGISLLEAATTAKITLNNLCGGDGICGRCKMVVKEGEISEEGISGKLSREEVRRGVVLACQCRVKTNMVVEIPEETLAKEKIIANEDAKRFQDFKRGVIKDRGYTPKPLVQKVYLELEKPTLMNNLADHQRVCLALRKKLGQPNMQSQMGLKILKSLPRLLREHDFRVTATVGLRREIAEVMDIEGGNREKNNYMVIVDMGTTTIVAHLVNAVTFETIDAEACFNSQGVYGREVTGRMIMAERKGVETLQKTLIEDINQLIDGFAAENKISLKNITAVICAGNTAMGHFLLGLPTENIRRTPYASTSIAPPPLRAAEVGININPRGLLYPLPGISSWVGSDLSAGILATGIYRKKELSMLIDIGTNGEVIIGNNEWLIASSASAGPALEGASVTCGMRAESGAVEKVYAENGNLGYSTIGGKPPTGICGSGIIDMVAVLQRLEIIDRSGKFITGASSSIETVDGIHRYVLSKKNERTGARDVYITETDIENIITAKAAIFAAMKILLERLELDFKEIDRLYLAGAFGNYLDRENAIAIGLIPNLPLDRIEFMGNTSIEGAKIAAFFQDAFYDIDMIRENTTYYDLMGAHDYVEEFQKAMFLPHTDIELFTREDIWQKA